MTITRWTGLAHVLLAALSAGRLAAAGAEATPVPPYGAADFVPTPRTPIGYRADGNGWYPGANPPTQWWEGTPVQKEMGVSGTNSRYDPKSSRSKPQKVWSLGDAKSKNILWKSPIPGWGDAQPIVVGDRLIACCDPDVVMCYDANDGKVLWQDRLLVMTLPALGADRRKPGPAPDPQKARGWQLAWELARASYLLKVQAYGGRADKNHDHDALWPRQRPTVERCAQRIKEWQAQLPADLPPAIAGGMQQMAAGYQAVLAAPNAAARATAWYDVFNKDPYIKACDKTPNRATAAICWQGHVGGSFSTPVSDGAMVVVCFAYGQIGAYEVATGKRLWAFRDSLVPATQYVNHGASPWMFLDLVLIRSGDGQAIMGLDKQTGAVRWETAVQTRQKSRGLGANHGNYVTPVLMNVPLATGGMRPVLVTQEPPVLDPLTGEILGRLEIGPPKPRSDRGSMVGHDGLFFSNWGYDAPASPGYRHRLTFVDGKLQIDALPHLAGSPGGGANALLLRPGVLMGDGGTWYDPAGGEKLGDIGRMGEGSPGVLCGDLLVVRARQNPFHRVREDFAVTADFAVVDLKDPRKPRVISDHNLLGGSDLPADPIFDTHLKGFDKKVNIGCYYGLCAWFGCRVGGVVPKGDRLYIQSSVGMYCIAAPGSPPLRPLAKGR